MPRTIAIGDIHGCSIALAALIDAINPTLDDTIIPLGDFVDRGIDSKGVLNQLIALSNRCNLVPILGNHDQMMLHARDSESDFQYWLNIGGDTALDSYGDKSKLEQIPIEHFQFLEKCVTFYETDTHFFVHANYKPDLSLDQQDEDALRWLSLRDSVPEPHFSGKVTIVGHTPQREVLDLGHLICIDTGCCQNGWLTALDVDTTQIWQVDEKGKLRPNP